MPIKHVPPHNWAGTFLLVTQGTYGDIMATSRSPFLLTPSEVLLQDPPSCLHPVRSCYKIPLPAYTQWGPVTRSPFLLTPSACYRVLSVHLSVTILPSVAVYFTLNKLLSDMSTPPALKLTTTSLAILSDQQSQCLVPLRGYLREKLQRLTTLSNLLSPTI